MSARPHDAPVELRASVEPRRHLRAAHARHVRDPAGVRDLRASSLPGGDNLTLVGIALGAYGLTQASCRSRSAGGPTARAASRVIYVGPRDLRRRQLRRRAAPTTSGIVIVGRVLQGAGAISAAVMALAADLTRDEHRTKAMAMIGSTIGVAFALSLVARAAALPARSACRASSR